MSNLYFIHSYKTEFPECSNNEILVQLFETYLLTGVADVNAHHFLKVS